MSYWANESNLIMPGERQREHKWLLYYPFFLFGLNAITKLFYLTSEDIGLDEPFSIYHAQFPVPVLVDQLKAYNNPPLYEIILHFWIRIFGISPLSVRILPMLFASFCPVALFYLAKGNFSSAVGVLSSLLLSFSSLLMYYAHDCRVYSLFVLLAILSVHFYIRCVFRLERRIFSLVMFVICSTLLVYAHYFGFFVLMLLGLHLLIFARRIILRIAICFGSILVLYLPHLYPFIIRLGDSVSQGTWVEPPDGIESLYNSLWAYSNFPVVTVTCIVILVISAFKFLKAGAVVAGRGVGWLVIAWFLFAYLGMFIISYWVPMYIARYLIYGLPAYYLTLGLCIEYIFKNEKMRRITMGLLVFLFASTMEFNPDKKQPVSETLDLITKYKGPGTEVLVYSRDFITAFAYQYNRGYFSRIEDNREYYLLDSLLNAENIYFLSGVSDLANGNLRLMEKSIYFAAGKDRSNASDPIYKFLSDSMDVQWKKTTGHNWFVSLFKRRPRRSAAGV
jgi:mannosyltransferase